MKKSLTVPELSYYLRTKTSGIYRFLLAEGFNDLVSDGSLSYDLIPDILARYSARQGYLIQTWPIPDWLAAIDEPWARVAIEMYAESVSFPASLPPSKGKQIHDLIRRYRPAKVVQVGCFIGDPLAFARAKSRRCRAWGRRDLRADEIE